jgi:choline dehydrogenase-like flavoprotein
VASAHWAPKLEAILLDAGAEWAFSSTSPPALEPEAGLDHPLGLAPASRHVMGTCRMGSDPESSVVGPEGRFHDVENLLCADSSVFVTSSGYNPTLTIVALAHRAASLLTGSPVPAPRN